MNNIPLPERIVVNPSILYCNDISDTKNEGSFLRFSPYGYDLVILLSAHCLKELMEACFLHKVITPTMMEDWVTTYSNNRWRKNAQDKA
jgi:hypothetical protein